MKKGANSLHLGLSAALLFGCNVCVRPVGGVWSLVALHTGGGGGGGTEALLL